MNSTQIELISRVDRTIRRECLFKPGDTLVIALSGGADSSALLDLLSRLPDYNLRLVVAHLNHCLRGAESDDDEEFCRSLAARYAVPFEVRRVNIAEVALAERLNLEDAGRRARIAFLDEIRGRYGAAAVALAHHADDQAETVLMRLLRGSGLTGLSGMTYCNARGYVRPLLEISRSEIEAYLRCCSAGWREDASNSDTVYLRNRIRHELLPLLETYNPAIRSTLSATAEIISGDEILLEELTEQTVAKVCREGEGGVVCSVERLRALRPPLLRRVLRHVFKQVAGTLEGVGGRHINALCDMIHAERPNAKVMLPHGVVPVREYDRLRWTRSPKIESEAGYELVISGPGSYHLLSGGLLTVTETDSAQIPVTAGTIYLDPASIPFPWLLRTFRAGDRITPFGMSGRKKVKDLFRDRKVPLVDRRRIPLLWSGEELIWVAGICASERSRMDVRSIATVQVKWQPA